jgi:hypothetical protein
LNLGEPPNLAEIKRLLPIGVAWLEDQERRGLVEGRRLTERQVEDARVVGVQHPEKVRVLLVDQMPRPDLPSLVAIAERVNLITERTIGLTLRYAILIRRDHADSRPVLVHELAHTAQYERLGGIEAFVTRYLWECVTFGYPAAPLEEEVRDLTAHVCG